MTAVTTHGYEVGDKIKLLYPNASNSWHNSEFLVTEVDAKGIRMLYEKGRIPGHHEYINLTKKTEFSIKKIDWDD